MNKHVIMMGNNISVKVSLRVNTLLMPCSRHSSGIGVSTSACLRMMMIWLSVKRDRFIEIPPHSGQEKVHSPQFGHAQTGEFLLPVLKVASEIPIFQQTCLTRVPVSACFSANAICSSVQRVFFMAISSKDIFSMPEDL